jgi:pilus assembly protein Flp/PilA
MTNLVTWLASRVDARDEKGQGLVEYALILFLVSIVVIVALGLIGTNVNTIFSSIANAL